MMQKVLLVCLFFIGTGIAATAQPATAESLQKKQAAIQQEIASLRQSLQGIRNNKKASLNELALVKRKLELRERAIGTIQEQINMIRSSVNRSNQEIVRLSSDLDTLKMQYQKSVVYAYKSQSNYDFINFIFSASNFSDAMKRIQYLRSYRAHREQQALAILNTRNLLHRKITDLQRTRQQQDAMLKLQQKERLVFVEEKKEKDDVVNRLKKREKEIVKEMAAKAKADKQLTAGISAAIIREKKKEKIAADAIAKENNTTIKTNKRIATSPAKKLVPMPSAENSALSASFEKNRGKLPWPVDQGVVTMQYGLQKIEGIDHNNPGITIETGYQAPVKVVMDGKVTAVFDIDGNDNVVVKHGNYYTTYGNLAGVQVKIGQAVTTGQVIGKAAPHEDGNGKIEFIILNDMVKVNPLLWLRKR